VSRTGNLTTVIGVIGPHDLVDHVAALCEKEPGVRTERYGYDEEAQASAIAEAHHESVDAYMFTSVAPYSLTLAAGVLARPAVFVDHTGSTLLEALIRLLADGEDVSSLSIDTLPQAAVLATLAGVGLPIDGVSVMPYHSGLSIADIVTFHRKQRRAVVITCSEAVAAKLRARTRVLKLEPSPHAIQVALRQLLLATEGQAHEDAQIALGLVELSGGDDGMLKEAAALGGSLALVGGGIHLLVTTRGPLQDATNQFTGLPMLGRLAEGREMVRIGFGLGHSAAEAESLARRALSRARRIGNVAAVACLRANNDIVLQQTPSEDIRGDRRITVLAKRAGLSVQTVTKLEEISAESSGTPVTSREIAARLEVEQGTARRLLQRLERAGLAERAGSRPVPSGRPLTLYLLTL
jgi:hypothetical protein